MKVSYFSTLSREEIFARISEKTRPWSRLDLWTARNTRFHRNLKSGEIRLIQTGKIRGYVFADLTVVPTGKGTEIEGTVKIPQTIYAANAAGCLIILSCILLTFFLGESILKFFPYLWLPVFFLWSTNRLRGQIPELGEFIQKILFS